MIRVSKDSDIEVPGRDLSIIQIRASIVGMSLLDQVLF